MRRPSWEGWLVLSEEKIRERLEKERKESKTKKSGVDSFGQLLIVETLEWVLGEREVKF